MQFGDLKTEQGIKALNEFLSTKSYIEGYLPSQADTAIFEALKSAPSQKFQHALRWYNHISSYNQERKSFPAAHSSSPSVTNNSAKQAAADDDDVDLFGSDEDDAEADKLREERLKAYQDKKAKKPGPIAKSSVVLDVKPWDDETDMKMMEEKVRAVVRDGLVWGASKLVPVGYGIKKLQIMCTVEDEKVSIDELQETIQEFEDFVQSVDIAAFNKI